MCDWDTPSEVEREEGTMATKARARRTKTARPKLPPEVKAAYAELEGGVRGLTKSIGEVRSLLRKAERKIEDDARARVRALRQDAKTQLKSLQSRQHEVARMLKNLVVAAEGSWRDVKQSADSILADTRATAASMVERFRRALGA
jgi:hypothetical protein